MKLPENLTTPRLRLRPPQLDDAPAINAAIRESFDELHAWMDWALKKPTLADTRNFCRDAQRQHAEGSACPLLMLSVEDESLVGATGYARIDSAVPAFEVGYWCRTPLCGQGYVTEAVHALTRHAFEVLRANRVEVRMDDRNRRSAAVAERVGFELEGVIRNHVRDHLGRLRDTRIYALLQCPLEATQPR